MYDIKLTPESFDDLHCLKRVEQTEVLSGIKAQLSFEPTVETRNRKRLRPNRLAEWELRIREVRVFYDVDERAGRVKVVAIGCKKGTRLFIRGEEYRL